MTQLLTPEVRAALGSTHTYVAPEPLSRASIRYFALAIGADPQRWRDEAPPTLICETAQLTGRAVPDRNSYLGHTWELPLPVPCAMFRGGNDYRFERPARFDDVITTTWTLADATERVDRAGGALLLVNAEARYSAGDELLATNTETMIFRPIEPAAADAGDEHADATPPADGERSRDPAGETAEVAAGKRPQDSAADGATATAEPAADHADGATPLPRQRLTPGRSLRPLHRHIALADIVAYGAATWDWHRLHYDEAHARRLGAPAPLVDGQMLGALLAECVLRAAGPGARLVRLSYRNRAPVRAGETVGCAGTIATSDDAGFSVDLSVSVGEQLVVAPAFAQLAWTSN
ncbi:FAS1-like dehydratase domain-containing protein [Candidatus Poriferisodalis sp.]|uniref:FAS1-like dehydratase domain-containing protein n=1 Tax=Candidatus Poriferisodalis sp. TaxID=3101277 RepID=UPI003B58B604